MAKRCLLAFEASTRLLSARVGILRSHVDAASKGDPDGIHDLRVASRRLRAALSAHRGLFPKRRYQVVAERVRAITRALGPAREHDVTIALLEQFRAHLTGPPRAALNLALRRLRSERAACASAVVDAAAQVTAHDFAHTMADLFAATFPPSACYLRTASESLDAQFHTVCAVYSLWRNLPSEEVLHRIRIGLKKLRYACELYAPLYGDDMADLIDTLKDIQGAVGVWNDWRLARDHVQRVLAESSPSAADGIVSLMETIERETEERLDSVHKTAVDFFTSTHTQQVRKLFANPAWTCCRRKGWDEDAVSYAFGD